MVKINPFVLIATTPDRAAITKANIEALRKQTLRPDIVVTTSPGDAKNYIANNDLAVFETENLPLGRKWQHGVKMLQAFNVKPNPLIICGSDDILQRTYVEDVCKSVENGKEFIGCTCWLSYDIVNNKRPLYLTKYRNANTNFPIGSGKAFSYSLLQRMQWKLFDEKLNKRLDDCSYENAVRCQAKIELLRAPHVLAVKGPWQTLNPIHNYLHSANISIEQIEPKYKLNSLSIFDYVEC